MPVAAPSLTPRLPGLVKSFAGLLVAMVVALVALGVYVSVEAYWRHEEAAFATGDNLTRVIAERLEATLRRADNDLRVFAQFVPPAAMQASVAPRYRPGFEAEFGARLAQFPELANRTVVDANGAALYGYNSVAPGTSFADREWFRTLRDNPQLDFVISDVILARTSRRPTIVLARAIRDRSGHFIGTANTTLNLDVMSRLFASLNVGPNGRIVVRKTGHENRLVLRYPADSAILNSTVKSPVQARINAGEMSGRAITSSATDGKELAISFRVLEGYPISISVGIAKQDYLAEWRQSTTVFGIAGIALLAFLSAFVGLRLRSESRLARLAARLKQSQTALRGNEQFLRNVIESTANGILVEDLAGRILATNGHFYAMWQVPAAFAVLPDRRLLNQHMAMLLESPAAIPTGIDSADAPDSAKFGSLDLRDGRRLEVEASALRCDGELVGRVWSFQDVTERKRTDRMYRSIIESSADAFVAFDSDLRVVAVSSQAETIFAYAESELTGCTLASTILPAADDDEGVVRTLAAAVLSGDREAARRVCRVQARRRDGSEFPAEIQISGYAMGGDWQFTSFIRDISARVRADEQLAQMQKLDAIGQLTGGLAHDFNNILGIVIGSLDLLEVDGEDNRELRDAALISARRGAEVTKSLLAVARRQKLAPEDIGVDTALMELAPLLRQTAGKGVKVTLDTGSSGAAVHMEAGGFSAAILNLVLNARDAMPNGGELTIRTAGVTRAGDSGERHCVAVMVTDTGCGMAPEVSARAFEPFFTTKVLGKGTGLGLATVYAFARQCCGNATITSVPGKGTTVELLLPAKTARVVDLVPARVEADIRGHGESVLVVDDEPALARVVQEWLTELGYHVVIATDPQRALERLAQQAFDALVSDVIMPGPFDGATLAERAVQNQPGLVVLLMSGYAHMALDRIHGRFPLLDKPSSKHALGAALRTTLDQRRAAAQTFSEKSAA